MLAFNMPEWLNTITSLEFWEKALDSFHSLGPAFPIILAALESIIPPLPLFAIITLNIAAYGTFLGFLYSWIGTCIGCTIVFCFFRYVIKRFFTHLFLTHEKFRTAQQWVSGIRPSTLFLIVLFPFTPSSFLNIAFGISEYDPKKYLLTIYTAKIIMIAALAFFGHSLVNAVKNPLFLILAAAVLVVLYILSKKISEKYNLKD